MFCKVSFKVGGQQTSCFMLLEDEVKDEDIKRSLEKSFKREITDVEKSEIEIQGAESVPYKQ